MGSSGWFFALIWSIGLFSSTPVVLAQEEKPGQPIEYQPFFPEKWKEKKQPTKMIPWEGNRIVLLTTKADFDGKVMALFLKRLDAGWKLYADLVGRSPAPFLQHNGKVTIAAVPGAGFTCGMGCGHIGKSGIEVAGFYRDYSDAPGDYELVRKDPAMFPHYYFYEMGRNYYLFGDRFSLFTTGFAVAMRNVCMDGVGCKDPDIKTRQWIERWEGAFAKSNATFGEAFAQFGAKNPFVLQDIDRKPFPNSDLTILFASGFLTLRKNCGGDEWVKRFYHHLFDCPPSSQNDPDGPARQLLNWVVAASLAAGKDLSPVFLERWRFPFAPELWQALKGIDWGKKGLTVDAVFDALPGECLPLRVTVSKPEFVTAARKKRNLVLGGTFEDSGRGRWETVSWGHNKAAAAIEKGDAKEGQKALALRSSEADDVKYVQKIAVKPNTQYLLSGWIKVKDVVIAEKDGQAGANLSLDGGNEVSDSLVATKDWSYVTLVFDSGKRTEVTVCARLGFYYSTAKGKAWFDDICLIELTKS